MMHKFLIFVLSLSIVSCKTKNDIVNKTENQNKFSEYEQKAFEFINYTRTKEKLILADKPEVHDFMDCVTNLEQDTIFTKEEILFIKSAIEKQSIQKWNEKLVPNSKIVNHDTIAKIFKKSSHLGWQEFKQKYGKDITTYSSPIFLRNYTLCIFYFGKSCGSLCGHGNFALYKKEGSDWKVIKSYCAWIS